MTSSCTQIPSGLEPVTGFEIRRYLGTWYEIARLDHPFERGLSNVSAHYSLRASGGIRVLNRGYDEGAGEWKEVAGVAYFLGDKDVGSLKVSFFRPFYGGYHIIVLDRKGYGYAMVAGPSRSYLWILSRERELPDSILASLISGARRRGFETGGLIMVPHDREAPRMEVPVRAESVHPRFCSAKPPC